MKVSVENAEHYMWGENSDGWHLLKRDDVSVIRERVAAGGAEVMHYHNTTRQFFYILNGEATMMFENHAVLLKEGEGIEIEPHVKHQFKNHSENEVYFLVISVPSTREDRVNIS